MILQKTGRSPHGERGLKCSLAVWPYLDNRRSPHGERGLKYRTGGVCGADGRRSPHGERGLKLILADYSRI